MLFGLDATGEVAFYIIAYAVRSGSQASHRSAWVHHKSL